MKRILLCTICLMVWLGACGNPTPTTFNQYDSRYITRTTYPGPANCNAASIPGIFDAAVEHPSSSDQSDLEVFIKSLSSSFYSNGSNSIQFQRVSYTIGASGTEQMYQDPSPLLINGSSTTLTAATLQASGVVPPFKILVSGTNVPWTEIIVTVTINGQPSSGGFLIPSFDADPELYHAAHPQYPTLLSLHPFYTQIGVDEDFVAIAQQYCF